MRRPFPLILPVIVMAVTVAVVSCKGGGGGASSRPTRIEVDIAGSVHVIDDAALRATEPDHRDQDRRAWRVEALLGGKAMPVPATLEAWGTDGQVARFEGGLRDARGREAVLARNRRGEIVLAYVAPGDPFPAFHGGGGKRGKPPHDAVIVRGVSRLRLTPAPAPSPAPAGGGREPKDPGERAAMSGAEIDLEVRREGAPPLRWTRADLARVPALQVEGDGGDGQRDAWDLRQVVKTLVGPEARPVSVIAEGNLRIAITPAHWDDPKRVPILRINRRAMVRFQWVDAATLEPFDEPETEARDVRLLELAK